jgi:hypothetical protein
MLVLIFLAFQYKCYVFSNFKKVSCHILGGGEVQLSPTVEQISAVKWVVVLKVNSVTKSAPIVEIDDKNSKKE